MHTPIIPCVAILLSLLAPVAVAVEGVTEQEILIGQSAALTGPAAGLGTGMNLGLKACIAGVNAKGGVHGRSLRLVTADDGYDPDRCIDATVKLLEEDKVFCLAGYVGTPTGKAAMPVIAEKKVPLVGLFTGAMIFRNPVNPWLFNIRASYDDETELLVARLTGDLGAKKIAVFYQNDSFGQAGLSGTEKALARRQMQVAAKGTYERNTVAVKAGLAQIMAGEPDAVISVGTYKPIAAFIKEARAAGLNASMATISFVGTENLIEEMGRDAEGVIISQVVPSPHDTAVPVVKEYLDAIRTVAPDAKPGYVSLEGYISARVLILGLEKAGKELTRDGLANALEGLADTDLGGVKATFSKQDHQALDTVYLTRVAAGRAAQVTSLK